MRVVVTGGAGFIGANLCRALLPHAEVVVFDDLSTGHLHNLRDIDAEVVVGSLLDTASLGGACRGADAIVHLGALGSVPRSIADPLTSFAVNAIGTQNVLECARHDGAQVILASSSSVYGSNPVLPRTEELATRPMSPYAASKLSAEGLVLGYATSYGLPALVLRFFNVFGPLQTAGHVYAAVIPQFARAALSGEPLIVHGDGLQSRDFTYVDTVCQVLVDAVCRRVTSDRPTNLAFGSQITLLDVVAALEQTLGHSLPVEHGDLRPGDVRHSSADGSRIRSLFPAVEPIEFHAGLANTVEWMRSELSRG